MIVVARCALCVKVGPDVLVHALFSGLVYNVTPYMDYHPGGEDELMKAAGIDGTDLFDQVQRKASISGLIATVKLTPLRTWWVEKTLLWWCCMCTGASLGELWVHAEGVSGGEDGPHHERYPHIQNDLLSAFLWPLLTLLESPLLVFLLSCHSSTINEGARATCHIGSTCRKRRPASVETAFNNNRTVYFYC